MPAPVRRGPENARVGLPKCLKWKRRTPITARLTMPIQNQPMSQETTMEKHAFQAEVQQLLHLMIHSLYSNREIFLRELVSNASDACDRLRFLSLTDKSLLEDEEALCIEVDVDTKARTITVRDNGIGMDHDEVIENIGTIARSGTRRFLEQINQGEQSETTLIGQFGVGFYSSFLVAEEVVLLTRKAGQPASEGVKWSSDGSGEYSVESVERPERGTEVILKLQKAHKEFLEGFRVRGVIAKYSDHISLPIRMLKEPERDDKGKIIKGQTPEYETVNRGSALWARPKREISEEEHRTFYTSLTYDPEPPAITLHNRVEGKLEYISLFYIPSKAPYDLWDREQRHGIKLYVRRIFISDDTRQLMPSYLRFVRGLVDSADLPLNVSREFLQQNREIDRIRAASVKKILAELKKVAAKDAEKYLDLWKEYGKVLKEGLIEDPENKDNLAKLIRFASTRGEDDTQNVSLEDYVGAMKEKQKAIYYVTAENHAAARSSPHLEIFRKHDIEVLLLSDPVDEWVVNHLTTFEDRPLQSIARGELDLDELGDAKDKDESEKANETLSPLVERFKAVLEDRVKDVRLTDRLVDSPACLVADQYDLGGNMERILKAMGQDAPVAKPILELNPKHEILDRIDLESDTLEDWIWVLLDQAVLAEGASLRDPAAYVARVNRLLAD